MTKNKKGFTIIAVVLVLAIAGLIFLMVFIALPALQRSQRNTRRRQDMARILSAFTEYQSNNNGKMPGSDAEMSVFVKKYVMGSSETDGGSNPDAGRWHLDQSKCYSDQFCDPDGTPYRIPMASSTTSYTGGSDHISPDSGTGLTIDSKVISEGKTHNIIYRRSSKCGSKEGQTESVSGVANITVEYVLEGGAIYCGDNQ